MKIDDLTSWITILDLEPAGAVHISVRTSVLEVNSGDFSSSVWGVDLKRHETSNEDMNFVEFWVR